MTDRLQQIYQLIRHERWFAHKHLTPTQVSIRDSAHFEGDDCRRCEWLLVSIEPEPMTYSVVIGTRPDGQIELVSPLSFVERVRSLRAMTTQCGGALHYRGTITDLEPSGFEELDAGNSSNSLYQAASSGRACVAKYYRKLDGSGEREENTLSAMQGQKITPDILAAVRYQPPESQDHSAGMIICLFMELISGEAAFLPFQTAARGAIDAVLNGADTVQILQQARHMLPHFCAELGKGIADFHMAALRQSALSREQPPLVFARFVHGLCDRWQRVENLAENAHCQVPGFCAADRPRMRRLLNLLRDNAREQPQDLLASYSHGDLHLSHIIIEAGSLRCRVIDPAHGLRDRTRPDHSAHDLFQIHRGFECFIFDEVATRMAHDHQCSREAAGIRLARGNDPDSRRLMEFASVWSRNVFESVLGAYRGNLDGLLAAPLGDARWRFAFYLQRLLHEANYNIVHDRAFFLNNDGAFLQQFLIGAERLFDEWILA